MTSSDGSDSPSSRKSRTTSASAGLMRAPQLPQRIMGPSSVAATWNSPVKPSAARRSSASTRVISLLDPANPPSGAGSPPANQVGAGDARAPVGPARRGPLQSVRVPNQAGASMGGLG